MFYSVGHTGVIFDYEVRQQRLLQVYYAGLFAAAEDRPGVSCARGAAYRVGAGCRAPGTDLCR